MLGIFNFERVFPITLKALKGVLQTKKDSLIKSPLVMNDIDNILGKRGYCVRRGYRAQVQRGCCRLSRTCMLRYFSPGFGPKEWK